MKLISHVQMLVCKVRMQQLQHATVPAALGMTAALSMRRMAG
jgi:hypothetical protein